MDADDLYRLAPEDFTAARDAAAKERKAAGDKEGAAALTALRKPSVAAWLVNRLAAEQPDLLGQLLDLGPELAQAQSGRDAGALRELGAQRRQLVDAVVGTAVEGAGRSVTAAVREEVASTLDAALADPATAQAVRSGRLVRALSYAGFGEVDLDGAVAPAPARRPAAGKAGPAKDGRAEKVAAAEREALEAQGRLDDAVRACEAAERARADAAREVDVRTAEVERLEAELVQARTDRDAAVSRSRSAEQAAEKALATVRRVQETAERARAVLDALRRG